MAIPLGDPRAVQALRNALGGTDETTSIVVNVGGVTFAGVVPSRDEAFRTGQAVGEGIASTLSRRNVRTGVRVLSGRV
jgi:aspartokinase-like uncharacterized kinase